MNQAQEQAAACFQSLENLYTQLDQALAGIAKRDHEVTGENALGDPGQSDGRTDKPTRVQGNPCGRCRECCTGKGLTLHNVTRLELDYIAERVGSERMDTFKQFLARDGHVEVCPYFDEQAWGCGIYAHRPYSCRVFGHHRQQGTALPAVCVFAGQEKVFGVREFYTAVPLAAELRDLVRRYWPYQADHFDEAAPDPKEGSTVSCPGAGDALDRALALMAQDRLQAALEEFEASDLPSTPYVLYCLSLVFEGLERHADACQALEVAIEQAPDCVPLWFRLACNRYSQGQDAESERAFLGTLELNPNHALAHSLLGGHYRRQGQKEEALSHLRRARELAPQLESFRRLLGSCEAT